MTEQPVQTPASAAAMAFPFTVAQFALMAVFAVLVVLGILWGIRMKRRRIAAQDDLAANREAAGVPLDAPVADAPVSDPVSDITTSPTRTAPPVTPAPPALADTPEPAAAPEPAKAAEPVDDITRLKGLGPKLAATLAELGITRIDQIAAMSPQELEALDARLGAFKGRPARDRWAEQARLLTAGDTAAYEAEFGKLGG